MLLLSQLTRFLISEITLFFVLIYIYYKLFIFLSGSFVSVCTRFSNELFLFYSLFLDFLILFILLIFLSCSFFYQTNTLPLHYPSHRAILFFV